MTKLPELPERIVLSESPIADVRNRLRKKRDEYYTERENLEKRCKYAAPEVVMQAREIFIALGYRISLIDIVLEDGEVDVARSRKELQKWPFDQKIYSEAVFIINDYCKTGGKNVKGSRGF